LRLVIGTDEFKASGRTEYFLFGLVFGTQDLEDGVECDHKALFVVFVVGQVEEDGFGCENKYDGRGVI
jgi:hypothetical protein